jgi:hypothetical protein
LIVMARAHPRETACHGPDAPAKHKTMIDAIITFSIRHRALVLGASIALAALGAWAAWETPVDAIPDLSENQIIVVTEWKGHGPREIEDQVTYPLSLGLRGLPGVRVVRSSSDVGFALLSVIFEDGVNLTDGRRHVAERLARVRGQLPAGANPELTPDAAATGQIFWYTVEGTGYDLGRLRAIPTRYPGLVRPPSAWLRRRSGGRGECRWLPDRVSGHPRSQPPARFRRVAA